MTVLPGLDPRCGCQASAVLPRGRAALAVSSPGVQQWVQRYNGPGPDGGGASWVAVSPTTGTVYVTGHSSGNATGYDYATVAYQG